MVVKLEVSKELEAQKEVEVVEEKEQHGSKVSVHVFISPERSSQTDSRYQVMCQ